MVPRSRLTFVAEGRSVSLWNAFAADSDRMWRLRPARLETRSSVYRVTSGNVRTLIECPVGSGLHQGPSRKRSCTIGLWCCGQLGFRGTGQMEWS